MNNSADIPDEVDIIVAGGGTAGCVVAARLAKAAPDLSILIVEGGIDNKDAPTVIFPALYLANLVPDTKTANFHVAKASPHVNGREVIVPTGGCLGGGSSINFMMYTRAQGRDFDSFKTEGWSATDLLPLLQKTETYHNDDERIDKSVHGYDGDFHVSKGTHVADKLQNDHIQAAKKVGYDEAADANDLKEGNAFQRWLKWIHPTTGRRQDAAHVLVHPLLEAGNTGLKVLTEHKVVRVLFDGTKAVGIECVANKSKQAVIAPTAQLPNETKTIKARKLVVVSAGALGTPSVLERSGVGKSDILKRAGIDVVSEIDGVGENYQDHHLILCGYHSTAAPEETLDGIFSGRYSVADAIKDFDSSKPSLLGTNALDIASKIRLSPKDLSQMPKSFQDLYRRDFADPSRPILLQASGAAFLGDHSSLPPGQYFTIGSYSAYPYSRGTLHITSSNVDDPAEFDTGFLSHDFDVQAHIWAWKKHREVVRRMEHFVKPIEGSEPKFSKDSPAAKWDWPTDEGSEIPYSADDDKAIEAFVRENVQTTWHSCGTCAMRGKNDMGVVDKDLNVYGVQGLKLADLSILPENVGANTNSTALLVGEKAAVIIAGELGIKLA